MFNFCLSEQGWEDIVVKQDQSDENQSEMKISLPCMPSLYIISFLFRACEEVHRVGGHVLDKKILHQLASRLLEKVSFPADVLVFLIFMSTNVLVCLIFMSTGNYTALPCSFYFSMNR